MIRRNLALLSLGFVIYATILLIVVWSDLKSGANYDDLSIRTEFKAGAIDLHSVNIKFVSPWATETELMRNSQWIWRVPNKEKRLVSKVVMAIAPSSEIRNLNFEYSFDTGPDANWQSIQWQQIENNVQKYQLVLPTRSSFLFPKYDKTLNWKGDFVLFLKPGLSVAYTLILLTIMVFSIFTNWPSICAGAKEIGRSFKPSRGELVFGVIVLLIFAFLGFRNSDLPTVMYRQYDELSILRPMESPGFKLVYGSLFNLTCLPFLAPGLLADNFSWSIIGGRMQSALSMVLVALIFRRILGLYFHGASLTLLSLFPFLVPFFWIMGTLYHPDAQMTAFLLGCCYFLLKDRAALGFNLYLACVFFAAAVAVKLHALMFAPLIPLYILNCRSQQKHFKSIISMVRAAAILMLAFLFLEPRMLSFSYLLRVIDGFKYQLWTNKSGFSVISNSTVSLEQKISTVSTLYSPTLLLVILTLFAGTAFIRQLFSGRVPLAYFYVANLTAIIYYVFLLNKDWPYYYLALYFLFLTMAVIQVATLVHKKTAREIIAAGLLALQLLIPLDSWRSVRADFYMPDDETKSKLNAINATLMEIFSNLDKNSSFLITYGIPFDYRSIGINEAKVFYLWTGNFQAIKQQDYSFIEEYRADHIILRRKGSGPNILLLNDLRRNLPSFSYRRVFQDESVEIFSTIKHDN